MDTDVIKTYVADGLGIGIIASVAYEPETDVTLEAIEASHLFASNTTRLGVRRGAYLRNFDRAFIELFAPHLTHDLIDTALRENADDYEI
jgi:LysR family cys regulon transcriptional activator